MTAAPRRPRVLVFAGSARGGSANRRLASCAARALGRAGAETTLVELRDHSLPLYDGDLEAEMGIPGEALALKALFLGHDALLIASPEYNSSVTPLLKNLLDWVSRSAPGEPSLACYRGKCAALVAASPGALGGLRGLVHLRSILGNIGVLVIPEQLAVGRAQEAFDPSGDLRDEKHRASLAAVARSLVRVTAAMIAAPQEKQDA